MDGVERLQAAASSGHPLRPGLSPAEVAQVRSTLPVPLPHELVRLMAVTSGTEGLLDLDLTGARHDVGAADLLPAGHPVAADGRGNFWLLDLTPETVDVAPVFFLGHDPAVLVYVAPDLATFLDRALAGLDTEEVAGRVWATHPGATDFETAVTTGDHALLEFARSLGPAWTFVDLRHRDLGDGVAWGRFGPRTRLARHGWERIFACAPYEKPPSRWRRARLASVRRAG